MISDYSLLYFEVRMCICKVSNHVVEYKKVEMEILKIPQNCTKAKNSLIYSNLQKYNKSSFQYLTYLLPCILEGVMK